MLPKPCRELESDSAEPTLLTLEQVGKIKKNRSCWLVALPIPPFLFGKKPLKKARIFLCPVGTLPNPWKVKENTPKCFKARQNTIQKSKERRVLPLFVLWGGGGSEEFLPSPRKKRAFCKRGRRNRFRTLNGCKTDAKPTLIARSVAQKSLSELQTHPNLHSPV